MKQKYEERPPYLVVSSCIKGVVTIVNFEITEVEDGFESEIVTLTTKGKATIEDIRKAVIAEIDSQTDDNILKGFVWNGIPVWLSVENQLNFKAAYDIAVQTNGSNLPILFKLGENEQGNPVYHTFESLDEFSSFYMAGINFKQQCLNDGWERKDSIDWSVYGNEED